MAFTLPDLQYSIDALAPYVSAETLRYHYGKHHKAYVDKLNELTAGTEFAELPLEKVLLIAEPGPLLNSAEQHYNHSFYWQSLSPTSGGDPRGTAADAIKQYFGSFEAFKKEFNEAANGHFGSGWAWLVRAGDGALRIITTHDAGCPIRAAQTPIINCDLWDHAYYIDYRNGRSDYMEAYWHLVDWDFAAANLELPVKVTPINGVSRLPRASGVVSGGST